ncbi:c2H2-type domain-containing protein [Trichonephila clavipes]|nr:c2H2-type domain-containing protein [Trichonephila clavipes]
MDDNHSLEQQSFSVLSEKEIAVNAGKHVCAFCDEKFRTLKELKKHYELSHDEIELKHEEHVFNTDESFQKWKKEEEVRTKSLFVKNGGVRKRAKNKQFFYYICNRSGIAKLKSERKRNEKIGGSVKCGKTCPAYMTVIREQKEEAIKIIVQYQSVHGGHEMQVGKLRLYREDRRNLAALLKVGVPYTNIIENIKKKCPPTERLGLLTKKDLHNVSRDFEVDESILHGEDSNRLRREKEAILKEKEKSVLHEEPTELVYEQVKRDVQLLNNVIYMANAEQIKRIGQDVKNILQYMGVSPFCSSLPSIQNFQANKNIVQQQKSRHFKKQKLANDTTRQEDYNCEKRESLQRDATVPCEAITGVKLSNQAPFCQILKNRQFGALRAVFRSCNPTTTPERKIQDGGKKII